MFREARHFERIELGPDRRSTVRSLRKNSRSLLRQSIEEEKESDQKLVQRSDRISVQAAGL
jgi:hypothetical protein